MVTTKKKSPSKTKPVKKSGSGHKKKACPKNGKGFFSDLGSGLLAGITLGAVRTGKTNKIGFLPFGKEGFATKLGINPSDVAALAGHPKYSAALKTIGQGGGSYGVQNGGNAFNRANPTTANRWAIPKGM